MPARTAAGASRACARAGTVVTGTADRAPAPGRTRSSPGRRAGASRGARAPRGSSTLRGPRLRRTIVALHVVHQSVAAALLQGSRALHEHLLRLHEVLATVPPDPRM